MKFNYFTAVLCVLVIVSCSKNEKTIYVSDAKADCTGVAPQKCLQIKEKQSDEWTYYYDAIEGFDYEEGYNYKIKVEVSKIDNPPADASSEKYTLVEIIEKVKAPRSLVKGSWKITKILDFDTFDREPFFTIAPETRNITGSTGCNRFFGTIYIEEQNIKITNIGATKMMCPNMDAENAFLKAINEVAGYTINNDILKLLSENKEVLMECTFLNE